MTNATRRQVEKALDKAFNAVANAASELRCEKPRLMVLDQIADAERWLAHAKAGLAAARKLRSLDAQKAARDEAAYDAWNNEQQARHDERLDSEEEVAQ